jgi:hypothetical protein
LYPRGLSSSYTPPWEPEISQIQITLYSKLIYRTWSMFLETVHYTEEITQYVDIIIIWNFGLKRFSLSVWVI